MNRTIIKNGQRFGRLVVIKEVEKKNGKRRILCKCDCGDEKEIELFSLVHSTKSCGCLSIEAVRSRSIKHGRTTTVEYQTWVRMKGRCYNKNNKKYQIYGARGIRVCDRWKNSFENFVNDMGLRPGFGYSIDRIHNDSHYAPENCRWATASTQTKNRSINVLFSYQGKTQCLSDWAEEYKINYKTLHSRVRGRNWSIEKALTTPVRE